VPRLLTEFGSSGRHSTLLAEGRSPMTTTPQEPGDNPDVPTTRTLTPQPLPTPILTRPGTRTDRAPHRRLQIPVLESSAPRMPHAKRGASITHRANAGARSTEWAVAAAVPKPRRPHMSPGPATCARPVTKNLRTSEAIRGRTLGLGPKSLQIHPIGHIEHLSAISGGRAPYNRLNARRGPETPSGVFLGLGTPRDSSRGVPNPGHASRSRAVLAWCSLAAPVREASAPSSPRDGTP
jgi:hypothetical protein